MSIRVHVDVVSAEELIFSGQIDFAVSPAKPASSASTHGTRRC